MVKRLGLSLLLCFLFSFLGFSQVDTTLQGTLELADGRSLVTLRVSYDSLWPFSEGSLGFYDVIINDGSRDTHNFVWAGSDRYVDFNVVLSPGSYVAHSFAYMAWNDNIVGTPGNLESLLLNFEVQAHPVGVPTLQIPPPTQTVTLSGSTITINLGYSLDNLPPGGVSYVFEIHDNYGSQDHRYYTSLPQYTIEDAAYGTHIIQTRVMVTMDNSDLGYSPYVSNPSVVVVEPRSELVVPWYANLSPDWSTYLMITCETPGNVTFTFNLYHYEVVGGVEVLRRETFSINKVVDKSPLLLNCSDILGEGTGWFEIDVDGSLASGLSYLVFSPDAGSKSFGVTPLPQSSDAATSHKITGQVSGDFSSFSAYASYIVVNPGSDETYFDVTAKVSGDSGCLPSGKSVYLGRHSIRARDVFALAYSQQFLKTAFGVSSGCTDPLVFSLEIVAATPVYVQAAQYDISGGFGMWNE